MRLFAPVAFLSVALSLPAMSQTTTMFDRSPEAILDMARSFGTAQFDTPDSDGRPAIDGEMDGLLYGILLYGCDNPDGCESVQFFASFTSENNNLEFVNAWNQDKRYATAYIADDGAAVLAYSANIDFGVTRNNFYDTFDIWSILLADFGDRIFGTGAEAPAAVPPTK